MKLQKMKLPSIYSGVEATIENNILSLIDILATDLIIDNGERETFQDGVKALRLELRKAILGEE